jgi:hypothetical protein
MNETKVFNDKRAIFLNPEQESETKNCFCDVSLNKDQQISQDYLSVKENFIFSVKKQKMYLL